MYLKVSRRNSERNLALPRQSFRPRPLLALPSVKAADHLAYYEAFGSAETEIWHCAGRVSDKNLCTKNSSRTLPEHCQISFLDLPYFEYKVKIVPKTESGLPDDRYETEAIVLSVRTPVNYGQMVGTLRAGVENLPENFNLFMKIDNEWMKIPRPKNNENDAEIWNECFVNQPKASRVLYLVEMPKVKKTKPEQNKSETEIRKAEMQALADEIKTLKLELANEKSENVQQRKDNEEKDEKLDELKLELETVKEKSQRAGTYSDLDRKMGLKTNISQDFKREILPTPFLSVTPTACTVPAKGGLCTFPFLNPGTERLAFGIEMTDFSNYTVSPVFAFIEAGATASIQLTRKAGPPQEDRLYIHFATVSPDATDAKAAFLAATRTERIKIPVTVTA